MHDHWEAELHRQLFAKFQTDSGRGRDDRGVLTVLEMARFWRGRDVSFAAIQCRVQRLGLYRSRSSRSKIQRYLDVLIGVFVSG